MIRTAIFLVLFVMTFFTILIIANFINPTILLVIICSFFTAEHLLNVIEDNIY